jgi:ABC-type transport system involved in cytochrome c biogenesis permease component
MTKFSTLFTYQVKKFAKAHHLTSHLFWTLLASSIALPLIAPLEQIAKLGPMFFLASLAPAILALSDVLLYHDQESGDLDFALMHFGATSLALAKFSAASLFVIISLLLCMPFFAIFYSLNFFSCAVLFFCSACLSLQSVALAMLLAAICCYFAKRAMVFCSIVLPFIIPMLLCCGMFLEFPSFSLALILFGTLLLTAASSLLLSGFLLDNIS